MSPTATLRARLGRFAARSVRALCWTIAGALAPLALGTRAARAQTLEDAEMLKPRELHATAMYGHDAWDQYWEGDRFVEQRHGVRGLRGDPEAHDDRLASVRVD
jgi:hypothetical protein